MEPEREYVRKNGDKVQEYYWSREMVVYINNHLTSLTFNAVVDKWKKEDELVDHNDDCPARIGKPVCICPQLRRYA